MKHDVFLFNRYGMQEKGDEAAWNVMLNRFMNEQNAQEKRKLLSGLGKWFSFS